MNSHVLSTQPQLLSICKQFYLIPTLTLIKNYFGINTILYIISTIIILYIVL